MWNSIGEAFCLHIQGGQSHLWLRSVQLRHFSLNVFLFYCEATLVASKVASGGFNPTRGKRSEILGPTEVAPYWSSAVGSHLNRCWKIETTHHVV